MRYNKIRKMDIANGPGVRVSIFMQGCAFRCPGCFNPETHDFSGGQEFTEATINQVLQLCAPEHIQGLSILGGEPLHPQNLAATTALARAFKQRYPQKTLWIWTGFRFEDVCQNDVFHDIDVLVDGQFQQALADPMLKYKGSANQRVINVLPSITQKTVVLYDDAKE